MMEVIQQVDELVKESKDEYKETEQKDELLR